MYIPPAMDLSQSIIMNQKLFEKMMCKDLGLTPAHKVLDLGSRRGRVASHMAQMSGAYVTGMNIDQDQLQQARKFAAEMVSQTELNSFKAMSMRSRMLSQRSHSTTFFKSTVFLALRKILEKPLKKFTVF